MIKGNCYLVWKKPDINGGLVAGDVIRIIIIKDFVEYDDSLLKSLLGKHVVYEEYLIDNFYKLYENNLSLKQFYKDFEIIKQIPNVMILREHLIKNYNKWFKKNPNEKFTPKIMTEIHKDYEKLKNKLQLKIDEEEMI